MEDQVKRIKPNGNKAFRKRKDKKPSDFLLIFFQCNNQVVIIANKRKELIVRYA